jgi:hypothetical protein
LVIVTVEHLGTDDLAVEALAQPGNAAWLPDEVDYVFDRCDDYVVKPAVKEIIDRAGLAAELRELLSD